jgi:hypothetical protein
VPALSQTTRHVLVVAGPEADLAHLRRILTDRVARGPAEFTLLLRADDDDPEAPGRLLETVELLRASGLDVAGQLGPAEPADALAEAFDPREHDEILYDGVPPTGQEP